MPDNDSLPSAPTEAGAAWVIRLDQLQPEAVEWLWEGWIPLKKVTVLEGDPNLGKSTLLLDLAARLSRGAAMPDRSAGLQSDVTIVATEDGLNDTLLPRLLAAGADLSRIHVVRGLRHQQGPGTRLPVIPGDLPTLEEIVRQNQSRLLLVDPLMAFLDRQVKAGSDQDVRQCLHLVTELAERSRCGVVLLRHLSRSGGGNALYRGAGGMGIIGAARSGLLATRDPDDENSCILASIKMNLAARPTSLRFFLEPLAQRVCRVVWDGVSLLTADDLLGRQPSQTERTAVQRAAELLHELLQGGPQLADICYMEAKSRGIAESTLRRAKQRLRVIHKQDRHQTGVFMAGTWELPSPRR